VMGQTTWLRSRRRLEITVGSLKCGQSVTNVSGSVHAHYLSKSPRQKHAVTQKFHPIVLLHTMTRYHRRTGQIFLGEGAKPSFPKTIFRQSQKNCYANQQNYFARLSPHPVIISKNPGFRALYLARVDGMNSVFFRLVNTNKYMYSFFHFRLLASARKI